MEADVRNVNFRFLFVLLPHSAPSLRGNTCKAVWLRLLSYFLQLFRLQGGQGEGAVRVLFDYFSVLYQGKPSRVLTRQG